MRIAFLFHLKADASELSLRQSFLFPALSEIIAPAWESDQDEAVLYIMTTYDT
jgi:hypothetical protein